VKLPLGARTYQRESPYGFSGCVKLALSQVAADSAV
jgi:hypothetical protein